MSTPATPTNSLTITARDKDVTVVRETLAILPPTFLGFLASSPIDIRVLEPGENFADVGKRFATADRVDYGICRGLYAPGDRQVIIKHNHPGIIAHEVFHHADFLLGSGEQMRSQLDDRVAERYHFHRADGVFISAYAGVNPVEMVAEIGRAALGFSMQPPGRPHDLERLRRIDGELVTIVESWLAEISSIVGPAAPDA